jgi:hypothetical protein
MIIGDRLRAMCEEKKLPQGDIEKPTGYFVAIFPAWRMATPFRPSKHWRRLPERFVKGENLSDGRDQTNVIVL